MVSRICLAADRVYEAETSNNGSCSSSHRTVSNPAHVPRGVTPPPSAVGPFAPVLAGQAIAAAGGGVGHYSGGGGTGGHPIRQKRAIDAEMRSLADLTKDDQVNGFLTQIVVPMVVLSKYSSRVFGVRFVIW